MNRRDPRESQDGDLPEAMGRKYFRRGRRFTPPGEPSPRSSPGRRGRPSRGISVQIGDVVAELTPRQAVVWLMNLDTMISLYESTTEQHLDSAARETLVKALRHIVREQGLRS